MSYLTILVLYFLISHIISFLCSILEAALLSTTPGYVSTYAKTNPHSGEVLKRLKYDIDRPLAAILTFNTAAHTFGATGIGAIVELLYGQSYVTAASVIVSLTMLYFSEMVPKTIGAVYWKRLIPWFIPVLSFMITLSYPFVLSFEIISRLINRGRKTEVVSEIEIKSLIEEGTKLGLFQESEKKMIFSVFKIADAKTKDFMINRNELCWLDSTWDLEQVKKFITDNPSDLFFVCEGSTDNPLGYAYSSDLLQSLLTEEELDIKKNIRSASYLPEGVSVVSLIDNFNQKKETLSFLVDEYGGLAGVVKLVDILDHIVKDIFIFISDNKPSIKKIGEQEWSADGSLPIEGLQDLIPLDILEEDTRHGYQTLAGFCLNRLQKIPGVGDEFVIQKFHFKITGMDNQRITKVKITRL